MAILRLLFSARCCSTIWYHGHSLVSRVAKTSTIRVLPVSTAPFNPQRHVSTGRAVWTDAQETSKPEEPETLDLDGWKSVMKSQASLKEKQVTIEAVESDCKDVEELEGEPTDSSMEALRNLLAMWHQAGKMVPKELTDEQLEEFAKITSKSGRKKYLKYLAVKASYKLSRKKKQQQKTAAIREAKMKEMSEEEDGEVKTRLFLSFWTRSMDTLMGWKTASAMMFGQPLVFDMSYDMKMANREIANTVSQLMESDGCNRRAAEPYHLHFCNLQHDGPYMQELLKRYGEKTWNNLLITTTHRHHLEVFPREQLVYLTADSPNVLHNYDHNKVYIIGAMVDRNIQPGLSLANAKRQKLNTARLPLDKYLHWEMGTKNLTLDQMMRIMLTMKHTGDWKEALKFVPERKHDGFNQKQTHYNRGTPTPESRNQWQTVKNAGFNAREKMTGSAGGENTNPGIQLQNLLKKKLKETKSAGRNEWWKDE